MCSVLWTFKQDCGCCAWSVQNYLCPFCQVYVINSSEFVCLLDKLQMANKKHNLKLLRIYGRAHERTDFPGMNQMSHC